MDHLHEFVRPTTGFLQVPSRLINDESLSIEARMALIWIGDRPDEYLCRTSQILDGLGIRRGRWHRIFRELREAGAVTTQWRQCRRTGRMIGNSYRWSWTPWLETTESRKTRPSVESVDNSTESRKTRQSAKPTNDVRKPDRRRPETRLLKEEREIQADALRAKPDNWARPAASPSACGAGMSAGLSPAHSVQESPPQRRTVDAEAYHAAYTAWQAQHPDKSLPHFLDSDEYRALLAEAATG